MMLLRKDGSGVIAIPQPSHAWLCGQMARAWGNRRFAAPMRMFRKRQCLMLESGPAGEARFVNRLFRRGIG